MALILNYCCKRKKKGVFLELFCMYQTYLAGNTEKKNNFNQTYNLLGPEENYVVVPNWTLKLSVCFGDRLAFVNGVTPFHF